MKKFLRNITLKNPKILCIGDIMLDSFTYGSVDRISPEAPVPILKHLTEKKMLGGVGNVVSNLAALGTEVTLICVVGDDAAGKEILSLLESKPNVINFIQVDKNRISTQKTRFVCGKSHLLRLDQETTLDIHSGIENRVLSLLDSLDTDYDVVIVSDYCKGFITDKIKNKIISKFINTKTKVIVDSKTNDLEEYFSADIVVPNLKELEKYTGKPLHTVTDINNAVEGLMMSCNISTFLVTNGSEGMILFDLGLTKQKKVKIEKTQFNAINNAPLDVSGAGDTVVASLALAIGSGLSYKEAAEVANLAAGIVIGKTGTATVSIEELCAEIEKYS